MLRKITLFLVFCSIFVFAQKQHSLNLLFNQKSATLSEFEYKKLEKFLNSSNLKRARNAAIQLQITGYIDMTQEEKTVEGLGKKRAKLIQSILIDSFKVRDKDIVILPQNVKDYKILPVTKEGQRLNRRVELKFVRKQKTVQRNLKRITAEITTPHKVYINSKQISGPKSLKAGDTLFVAKNGAATLRINEVNELSLNPETQIIIGKSSIKFEMGAYFYKDNGTVHSPVTVVFGKSRFRSSGLAFVEGIDDNLRLSQYESTTIFKTEDKEYTVHEQEGLFQNREKDSILIKKLPERVILADSITVTKVPGEATLLQWTSKYKNFHIQLEDTLQTFADKVVNTPRILLQLPFGAFSFQVQAEDSLGFKSQWSTLSNVAVTRAKAIQKASPIVKDDTIRVDDRFLDITFTVHHLCSLSLDTLRFSRNNNKYEGRYTLHEGLNLLYGVTHFPDSSVDTSEYYIDYSGYDERFTLNDTIMNLPAFTTTRKFILQGNFPTATAVSVNEEAVSLDETGDFKKKLTLRSYKKHPIDIDVTFENGNHRTIKSAIERKKHKTESEDALLKVLGLTVTAGILFLVGFGIE